MITEIFTKKDTSYISALEGELRENVEKIFQGNFYTVGKNLGFGLGDLEVSDSYRLVEGIRIPNKYSISFNGIFEDTFRVFDFFIYPVKVMQVSGNYPLFYLFNTGFVSTVKELIKVRKNTHKVEDYFNEVTTLNLLAPAKIELVKFP